MPKTCSKNSATGCAVALRNKWEAREAVGAPFDAASKATWAAVAYSLARRCAGMEGLGPALREMRREAEWLWTRGVITKQQGQTLIEAIEKEMRDLGYQV